MSDPNTLLVDGTDLRQITGVTIRGDMNLYAPGTRRGSDDVIPGRRGQLAAAGLPLDAYTFSIDVIVSGSTRGARDAVLISLASTLSGSNGDGLVTLTRKLASADDSATVEYTASGRFVAGAAMNLYNSRTGYTELQFVNLDGAWKRTSDSTWVIP